MGRFGSVKRLLHRCLCMPACLIMGAVVAKFQSRIWWWWWWVVEVLTFNLSSVQAIMFSFVLVNVSKAIGYFIWTGCTLQRLYGFSLWDSKQNIFENTGFPSRSPYSRVFQITQPNIFHPSHNDWQLFIKNNVYAHLPETSIMQCCFYNLFIEITPKPGWKLLKVSGLYTGRTVVGNHTDSNLPITEKLPISAKH